MAGHRKIHPDELYSQMMRALSAYSDEVIESTEQAANIVSKELLANIRADSPVGSTGEYKKGWVRKKLKYHYVIHNKNKPGLTHLLEHGHALKQGKRTQAIPHIKKNEEMAVEKLENLCIKIVSEGLRLK